MISSSFLMDSLPSLLHGAGLIMQEAGRPCVNQLIASLGILQPAEAF